MNVPESLSVSPRTRLARRERRLQALADTITLSIDASYFVDPDLQNPANDRTLIRAKLEEGIAVNGAWGESGGLIAPMVRIEAAQDAGGAYTLLKEATLSRGADTYSYTVPATDLPWEGDAYLRLGVRVGAADFVFSDPILVHLDRIAPYERSGITEPPAPRPTLSLVTEADLASGFNIVIPTYTDREAGDKVYVWLEKELPGSGTPPSWLVPAANTQAGDTTLTVPGDTLKAKGDGRFVLGYVLVDKAGNRSALSQATPVTLVLGKLPGTLQAPLVPAANPIIDRADALEGVYVDVPEMPEWQVGDEVRVNFGTQALAPYTLNTGAFEAIVEVPVAILLGVPGSDAGEVTLEVTYKVARLDWESALSPATSVKLDLSKAGPENPDWPEPINDDLPVVVVESDSGDENAIPETDIGKSATLKFEVYPGANEHDTVEFFWGTEVCATDTLLAADTPGKFKTFPVPWLAIEGTLDRAEVPVFYRVRKPETPAANYQQAEDTLVDVSALPLSAPSVTFPGALDLEGYRVLGCGQRVPDSQGKLCLAVGVPDLSQPPYNQKPGDEIKLKWKTFSGTTSDGATPISIPADKHGEYTEDHKLTVADLSGNGFTWFVPYEPYGAVTYRYGGSNDAEGMVEASYTITVGGKTAASLAPDNIITAFYDAGGACDAAATRGCTTCRPH